jgi:cell fate (sporulation/competence/biofilm development) regulator YlbF (YheA/YmcA/DUF963 family)
MDIIDMARELGKAIQSDERYANYVVTKAENDGDDALQELIGEFNLKRLELNAELAKESKTPKKVSALDTEIKSLYGRIMGNGKMEAYNAARSALDGLLNQINTIITLSANGHNPETCPAEMPAGCGPGGCASCSSCG